jgi:hypothetical protein
MARSSAFTIAAIVIVRGIVFIIRCINAGRRWARRVVVVNWLDEEAQNQC